MMDYDLRGLDNKPSLDTANISTLKCGGRIALALYPRTKYDLDVIRDMPMEDVIVLGNMSNVCVREGGYPGVAIMTSQLRGLEIEGDNIYVGAGERLSAVAMRLARLGYVGLERLAGIPASMGGAIYQNAGAFSQEIAESIVEVVVHDLRQGITYRLSQLEMGFGYRHTSIVDGREMIIGAVLRLKRGADAYAECLKYLDKRRTSQPQEPSLGSTFLQAPNGVSAGYYIDDCGYKGYSDGGIAVSTKHANFLVNTGGGSVASLEKVKNTIKQGVYDRYGITLKEEIRIIGIDENSRNCKKGHLK